MRTMKCPECDDDIEVSDERVDGDKIDCEDCGATLELAGDVLTLVADDNEDEEFEDEDGDGDSEDEEEETDEDEGRG